MRRSALLPLALALLASAAIPQDGFGTNDEGWRTVEPGLELRYPADHGAHPDTRTEWWYLTGHVREVGSGGTGRRFGFQYTIFRQGLALPEPENENGERRSPLRARQVWFGHLAIADVESGRMHFAERLRRGGTKLAGGATDDLQLALEDWSMSRGADDTLVVTAREAATEEHGPFGLAFELRPTKPLVLHGERGYSSKGPEPGNASAYATWPRLAVGGELELDGRRFEVDGDAWFDHEFGSSVLGDGVSGWDWFGLHLDDGRELMLFHLRTANGPATASAGTIIERDGTPRRLARDEFTIEPTATWTSPRTGATYPGGWRLAVPSAGIEVTATTLVPDSELATGLGGDEGSGGVVYWEGPVDLAGSVTGRGYAELTGYAGTMAGRF